VGTGVRGKRAPFLYSWASLERSSNAGDKVKEQSAEYKVVGRRTGRLQGAGQT